MEGYPMKIPFAFIAMMILLAALAAAAENTTSPQPDKATCLRIAGEMETNLQREILDRWFPAAVDERGGGFHENFGLDWSKRPGSDKSIVYQSRLTWTAAQAARRFPEKADFYLKMTRRGAACLADKMWDKERGGFYWSVDASSRPNQEGAQYKQTYGVAFGLYALSANYQATGEGIDSGQIVRHMLKKVNEADYK
jgi:mannobiose 2-epimerase